MPNSKILLLFGDTDTIIVKPLDDLPSNTIGFQDSGGKLNNAILYFEKHNPFIQECIKQALADFNNRIWSYIGPILVTKVFRSKKELWESINVHAVPAHYFQFFPYERIGTDCYQASDNQDEKMNGIREKAYLVHLNNHLAHTLQNGSICECLLNTFCLSESCSFMDRCAPLVRSVAF